MCTQTLSTGQLEEMRSERWASVMVQLCKGDCSRVMVLHMKRISDQVIARAQKENKEWKCQKSIAGGLVCTLSVQSGRQEQL